MGDISVTKIVETVESDEEDVREFVESEKLSIDDLEKLLEGEKAARNRSSVRNFLKSEIQERRIEEQIDQFDRDLNGIEELLEKYRIGEEKPDLPQEKVLKLVGSTVDELVDHLEETTYSTDKLEELREAEELVKDRKTAKQAIDEEIKRTKLGEDAERVSKDAEKLEEDMKKLESDIDGEGLKTETDEDFKDKLKQELDRLEGEQNSEMEEIAEAIEEEENNGEDPDEDETQEPEDERDEDSDPEEETKNKQDEEIDDKDDGKTEDEEDDQDESEDQTQLEKKKEIVEELELELSDDELEEIGVDELKQLREEKKHREQLIETLSEEFEEEMLRASSTSDLEKLKENLEPDEEQDEDRESDEEEVEDEEVDEEALKQEAEEELQMLMGANAAEKQDKEGESRFKLKEQFNNTKKQLKNILPGSKMGKNEDESSKKMDSDSVKGLLDEYSQLDSSQGTVKTAHVMKAFLEQKLSIDREMTYKELSEYIEENRTEEELLEIADTFKELHKDQYMGTVSIEDVESFIDNSKKVAEELG